MGIWVGLGWSWGRRGRAWVERFALHSPKWKWNGMGCLWKQYAGSHSARASTLRLDIDDAWMDAWMEVCAGHF